LVLKILGIKSIEEHDQVHVKKAKNGCGRDSSSCYRERNRTWKKVPEYSGPARLSIALGRSLPGKKSDFLCVGAHA
jgi:hypothetical protein